MSSQIALLFQDMYPRGTKFIVTCPTIYGILTISHSSLDIQCAFFLLLDGTTRTGRK